MLETVVTIILIPLAIGAIAASVVLCIAAGKVIKESKQAKAKAKAKRKNID